MFRHFFLALFWAAFGVISTTLVFAVLHLENRPSLKVWHTAELDAEFSIAQPVMDFAQYLQLEERLFKQAVTEVYAQIDAVDRLPFNRFHAGSLADPNNGPENLNRSFQLIPDSAPRAGVLLLHGMSDSPYSLRGIGEALHREGALVLGLRLPGHGTAPSGLLDVSWNDLAAAATLAARHLEDQLDGKPLYVVGYSTGGALAIHHALLALEDSSLPHFRKIVLISPSIGVTSMAALAVWQARIGRLLGLEKLEWNSISMEYDPYKYNSFSINASDQVYRLTLAIQNQLKHSLSTGALRHFPPVLGFQSMADATVSTNAVATQLFQRLPNPGNEFVLFDVNRTAGVLKAMRSDPAAQLTGLRSSRLGFAATLVTNRSAQEPEVLTRHWAAGSDVSNDQTLGLVWPRGIYSLSHTALPFALDDPLYGLSQSDEFDYQLGRMELRGERGLLRIPAADMLRLRSNPFFSYLEQRTIDFFFAEIPGQ